MNTEREHTEQEILRKNPADIMEEETESLEQEAEIVESVDYSHQSKEELVHLAESLLKESDIKKSDTVLKQIRPVFDEIKEKEKQRISY